MFLSFDCLKMYHPLPLKVLITEAAFQSTIYNIFNYLVYLPTTEVLSSAPVGIQPGQKATFARGGE